MTRDLYSDNNEFFEENVTESMAYEYRKYKKQIKKSKKKRKKKQKRLVNKKMKKIEKRIKRKIEKKTQKKLKKKLEKKYRQKFEKSKHSSSTEMYEGIIKRLICEVISQKIIKSPNTFIGSDEKVSFIDVPYKEVNK